MDCFADNLLEQQVYDALGSLGIIYERIEHPPVYTCEEADKFIAPFNGARTKSLFLKGRRSGRYYLVVMDENKRLDIHSFERSVADKNISFASSAELKRYLGLTPGSVSLFGILNDAEKVVKVLIDQDILGGERVSFHPNVNTVTIVLSVADMERFMDVSDHAWEGFAI